MLSRALWKGWEAAGATRIFGVDKAKRVRGEVKKKRGSEEEASGQAKIFPFFPPTAPSSTSGSPSLPPLTTRIPFKKDKKRSQFPHHLDVVRNELADRLVESPASEAVFPRRAQTLGRRRLAHRRQHVLVVLIAQLREHEDLVQVLLDLPRVDCGSGSGSCSRRRRRRRAQSLFGALQRVRLLHQGTEPAVLAVGSQDAGAVGVALGLQGGGDVEHSLCSKRLDDRVAVGVERRANVPEQTSQSLDEIVPAHVCPEGLRCFLERMVVFW